MSYSVDKELSGQDNLFALIQHTWPDHADVLNEENVSLDVEGTDIPGVLSVTISALVDSTKVTGSKIATYTVTDLSVIDKGGFEYNPEDPTASVVSFINTLPCLSDEIDFTVGEDTIGLIAKPGSITVVGSMQITIESDSQGGEFQMDWLDIQEGPIAAHSTMNPGCDNPLDFAIRSVNELITNLEQTKEMTDQDMIDSMGGYEAARNALSTSLDTLFGAGNLVLEGSVITFPADTFIATNGSTDNTHVWLMAGQRGIGSDMQIAYGDKMLVVDPSGSYISQYDGVTNYADHDWLAGKTDLEAISIICGDGEGDNTWKRFNMGYNGDFKEAPIECNPEITLANPPVVMRVVGLKDKEAVLDWLFEGFIPE